MFLNQKHTMRFYFRKDSIKTIKDWFLFDPFITWFPCISPVIFLFAESKIFSKVAEKHFYIFL